MSVFRNLNLIRAVLIMMMIIIIDKEISSVKTNDLCIYIYMGNLLATCFDRNGPSSVNRCIKIYSDELLHCKLFELNEFSVLKITILN